MSQVHESLSALLDGECGVDELDRLLDEMERDPELKTAWSRLCQAREAQEGTRISRAQPCICEGVMSRLDAPAPAAASPKVVPMTAPPPARPRADWKTWSGWAVAASVAVVAVALNVGGGSKAGSAGDAGPGFVPQVTAPVSIPLPTQRARNLQTVSLDLDEQDEDLRNYLIEHSNALADRGMGGTLSYARFAAHTADLPRPQPAVLSTAGGQP